MTAPSRVSPGSDEAGLRRIILGLFNPMPDKHPKGCLANENGPCICGYAEVAGNYLWALREAKKIAAQHYGEKEVGESVRLKEPQQLIEAARSGGAAQPSPLQDAYDLAMSRIKDLEARLEIHGCDDGSKVLPVWPDPMVPGSPSGGNGAENPTAIYAAPPDHRIPLSTSPPSPETRPALDAAIHLINALRLGTCPADVLDRYERKFTDALDALSSASTPSPVAGEGWRDLAARVMQLEAAGAKTLTCKQVLGLIAFVRDGEGVSVSSTQERTP